MLIFSFRTEQLSLFPLQSIGGTVGFPCILYQRREDFFQALLWSMLIQYYHFKASVPLVTLNLNLGSEQVCFSVVHL